MRFKQKVVHSILAMVIGGAFITSCGSGKAQQPATQPQMPQGPVSYQGVNALFSDHIRETQKSKSLLSGSSGCGGVMGDASAGVAIASDFISLIPVAGPPISGALNAGSIIAGLASGAAGSSCTSQDFANQQAQITAQSNATESLNQQLAYSGQQTMQQLYSVTKNFADTEGNTYKYYLGLFIGNHNTIGDTMVNAGLWQNAGNGYAPVPGMTISTLLEESQSGKYQQLVNEFNGSSQTLFQDGLQGLTGATWSYASTNESGVAEYSIQENTNLLLFTMLSSFVNTVNESANLNQSSYIEQLNQYNNGVTIIYQDSLQALNSAYQTQYLINMINFINYESQANGSNTYAPAFIAPMLQYDGLNYYPIDSTPMASQINNQAVLYNNAQRSLTLWAAGLANQLYLNTIGFLITDPLTFAQESNAQGYLSYYDAKSNSIVQAESISYVNLGVNSNETGVGFVVNAIGGALGSINNYLSSFESSFYKANNMLVESNSSIVLYQYGGLVNLAKYDNLLAQYNQAYGRNGNMKDFLYNYIPSSPESGLTVMTTQDGLSVESAVASTSTIQPYFVNESGYPELFGSVTNNIAACNGSGDPSGNLNTTNGGLPYFNFYIYTPKASYPSLGTVGKPYFMCGNWSTSTMPTNAQVTNTNTADVLESYTSLAPNFKGNNGITAFIYSNLVSNEPAHGLTGGNLTDCILGLNDNLDYVCGTFPSKGNPITITNFNTKNWSGNTNPNTMIAGSELSAVNGGWITSNNPTLKKDQSVTDLAAAQITLPDGFIAPIVLTNTVIQGLQGTYAGIGFNPDVASVMIDGQPLLSNSNIAYGGVNSWGIAASTTVASYDGIDSHFFNIPAIMVNGNTIMINSSITLDSFTGTAYPPAYITLNPSSCPGLQGPYANGNNLLPAPTSNVILNSYQIFNFVCNLPTYNGFFN